MLPSAYVADVGETRRHARRVTSYVTSEIERDGQRYECKKTVRIARYRISSAIINCVDHGRFVSMKYHSASIESTKDVYLTTNAF